MVADLQKLEEKQTKDKTTWDKAGKADHYVSKSLCVQAQLRKDVAGKQTWRIANVHLHRRTARREWSTAYANFLNELARMMYDNQIEVLVGDVNMALYHVCDELRKLDVEITWIASHLLRKDAALVEMLHSDSLGIFAIGPASTVRHL